MGRPSLTYRPWIPLDILLRQFPPIHDNNVPLQSGGMGRETYQIMGEKSTYQNKNLPGQSRPLVKDWEMTAQAARAMRLAFTACIGPLKWCDQISHPDR